MFVNKITKRYFFSVTIILTCVAGCSFFAKELEIKLDVTRIAELENVVPVAIVGSGPAGLAAGVYTTRAGMHTLIIEGKKPGGLLTETTFVENWPAEEKILGTELMERFKKQNQALGVQFLTDIVEKVDFSQWPYKLYTADGVVINALSVIVATGANPRVLGLAEEQKYWSNGVSACAVCDAPFYKNKAVVVVGGGDSAAEQVLQLAPHVKSVTMLVRKGTLRACKNMQEKVAAISNAKVLFNVSITQIMGDGLKVNAIEILHGEDQVKEILPIEGVFLAIGHDPASKIFKGELAMDAEGYLLLQGNSQRTSAAGIFAAGEVVDHTYRQAGVAAGDGIKAALDAVGWLQSIGFNADLSRQIQAKYFMVAKQRSQTIVQKIKTMAEFEDLVIAGSLPAVLDFYTDYCSSCMHMLPFYEAAAYDLQHKMNFFKINADEAEELVRALKIQRVPALFIYQNGEQVLKTQEFMTKKEMIDLFGKYTT